MKQPGKQIFALAFVLSLLSACALPGFDPPTPTPVPTLTPTSIPLYQMVRLEALEYSESGEGPDYYLLAHTPVLRGSEDALVEDFNRQIAVSVQQEINEFHELLTEMTVEPISAGSFFELTFENVYPGSKIISLRLFVDTYADGAAHPFRVIRSFNYDLEAGQEIPLEALFIADSNYLQVISDYCAAELNSRDIGVWLEGASASTENYQVWNITDEGLLITFNEYQVAPYAAGPQTVLVPYTFLTDILQMEVIP